MAFTIYEYVNVVEGEPIQPEATRTADCANGEPHLIGERTRYVAIKSDADMYLRISDSGDAATSDDHKLLAEESYGFPVRFGTSTYVYGAAA